MVNPPNPACEECKEFNLRECQDCNRPRTLQVENILPIEAWYLASAGGRDPWSGSLRIEAVVSVVEAMGGSREDVTSVMTIESNQRLVKWQK